MQTILNDSDLADTDRAFLQGCPQHVARVNNLMLDYTVRISFSFLRKGGGGKMRLYGILGGQV